MNPKIIGLRLSGTIFGLVAILHLLRIITGVPVEINGWMLPLFINWVGLIGAIVLCGWLWLLSVSRND